MDQMRHEFCFVEKIVANLGLRSVVCFRIPKQQHRHFIAILRFKRGILVDIDHVDCERMRRPQLRRTSALHRLQSRDHVITKMTIGARKNNKLFQFKLALQRFPSRVDSIRRLSTSWPLPHQVST